MAQSLGPEAIQALGEGSNLAQGQSFFKNYSDILTSPTPPTCIFVELIDKHRRASKNELYRQVIRRESEIALFVDTKSKLATLREIVQRDLGYPVIVKHPRLAYLRNNTVGAPSKNLGTPGTPLPLAQGQLPRPESHI
ncbi:hypothetical protein PGT21_014743 [Puccinia graminis f. sp. tritici]|uniref:Uncharacterized protein n=1 Tax=Puccinia graminis f. sp. tritici TaxID=56615 RepID=A0A5B0NCC1_PUCGR|nr:hypothetical protein PGT21_014743 [Puccinia graminis f. sp. tritici]